MKKLIAFIIIISSMYFTAFASNQETVDTSAQQAMQNPITIIEIANETQLSEFEAQLEKDNAEAQRLWEKALLKAEIQPLQIGKGINTSNNLKAYSTPTLTKSLMMPCGVRASLATYIVCDIAHQPMDTKCLTVVLIS